MKIKISIVLFVLLSLINMGAVCNCKKDNMYFQDLEKYVQSGSSFIENGVKLQYKTNNDIADEYSKIKKYITDNTKGYCAETEEYQFNFRNTDFNIDINLWINGNYTYVEIILLNSNNNYNLCKLQEFLKGLENESCKDVEYFLYYKGKLNNLTNKEEENFLAKSGIKNIDMLNINNGYAGKGNLDDKEKVNFALTHYNTGCYIIIGTPIIFATY